jgi:RNA polymerase sigma-70 factor (ECF subfamily)
MTGSHSEAIEATVRQLCAEGDRTAAATAIIRGHGPEIYGFLRGLHRGDPAADDVFAIWSERVWRALEGFGWECSLRTWVYVIARNASYNHKRDARVKARNGAPMPASSELSKLQEQVRSETRPYQRTEAKDKLAQIRESLPPDDQMLLVLRVDKQLEWKSLAQVMLGEESGADDARLTREAQKLRKRFQHLKERLIELGRRQGLLDGG